MPGQPVNTQERPLGAPARAPMPYRHEMGSPQRPKGKALRRKSNLVIS